MKRILPFLFLLLALIVYNRLTPVSAQTSDAGLFFREDCESLTTPVAYRTVCVQIGAGGTLTQGSAYGYDGSDWYLIGPTVAVTLDSAFDNGKTIDGANSTANAVKIGNGTIHWLLYCDGSNVCIIEPDTASNTQTRIMTNQTWCLYDVENTRCLETVDPDAASSLAAWTYNNQKPLKTIYIDAAAFSSDGTQCSDPAEATLNTNKPKLWSITCTDNNSGRITVKVTMPAAWDGGTIRIRPAWFTQDASNGGAIVQSWSGTCYRDGDAVPDSATTGEQNATLTFENEANEVQKAFTAAITLNGTCAGGASIYLIGDIDATGTTHANMAVARFLGAQLEYQITSRSD